MKDEKIIEGRTIQDEVFYGEIGIRCRYGPMVNNYQSKGNSR